MEDNQENEDKIKAIVKIDSIETLADMQEYAGVLVKSKMIPASTSEKVIAAYQVGKELGFGIMTALSNIHVIQGKPSLSVHACLALVKKAKVTYQTLEDYTLIELEYKDKSGDVKVAKTRRTTIKFYYKWYDQILTEEVSLTWEDAKKAGWAEKENWQKMPKVMLWNRCAVIGARRVCPDALLGMYESSEVSDYTEHIDLDEKGNPKVINLG